MRLIDKYVRKCCQIVGHQITIPADNICNFNSLIRDVFAEPDFNLHDWMVLNYNKNYSIIGSDGTIAYFCEGILHRTSGPALIYESGTKEWWKHNMMRKREPVSIPGIIATIYEVRVLDACDVHPIKVDL